MFPVPYHRSTRPFTAPGNPTGLPKHVLLFTVPTGTAPANPSRCSFHTIPYHYRSRTSATLDVSVFGNYTLN